MLIPHVRTVAAALHAYRSAWAGLLRDPASPHSYRRLDDAAYTLCVLMGQRNAADAAAKAERLLARASAERRAGAGLGRHGPSSPEGEVDAEPAADGSVPATPPSQTEVSA
ncbi:DUF5133 domain-containing protein [Streptomyces sp. NPDC050211]|uniref:DUF5133 domain-containing protein n=1 Tax=Streptomyces sp. NPDC050211 TaxID=3154932 RepID=UPI003437AF24